jgi:CRISPR-associated exonuclease Cas4
MDDDEPIPLSALQHYLYCPRQCALIHLEQQWAENRHTAEGRVLHGRVDQPLIEQRRGVRTLTAVPVSAPALGIAGVADLVEMRNGQPCPVEFKRGRPKDHRADEVQLCAQGLCLEIMFGRSVPEGALYYGQTRRRQVVPFDEHLRKLTLDTIARVRDMLAAGTTPSATYQSKRCDACSLIDICQPRSLGRRRSVADWLKHQIEDAS